MLRRAYRYRMYPTPEQAFALAQHAGATRFIYNLCLEQRRDWWRQYRAQTGRTISWASQSAELTDLRAEVDWLGAAPRVMLEQAIRDLDKAFAAFFAGRAGFPSPRVRGRHDAFRNKAEAISIRPLNAKWAAVKLPKIEAIKFRLCRPIAGKVKNATVSQCAGKWFVSFLTESDHVATQSTLPSVGIDRGIANTLSLSTSEHFQMPDLGPVLIARKRAQRALARSRKGSARRVMAKLRAARQSARVAAIRNHWLHERSTEIARRFGVVALEKLRIRNMSASGRGKRGLNRSILEQGWGTFATMLEYKLAERGGRVEYVDPRFTSQTCSACGCVARESRKSQAVFRCVECGHSDHADTNAALNIMRRSPACVEGSGYGPVEARTLKHIENLAA